MPVVSTVAIKARRRRRADFPARSHARRMRLLPAVSWLPPDVADVTATQREVRRILAATVRQPALDTRLDERIDRVVLHPLWGMLILAATLFLMFQAVFSWASLPMELIKDGVALWRVSHGERMPEGILRSLLVDGIIAGVGSVLVFLPQILILFLFILALEDSGYLPRAAFLLDRLMGTVGLSGRSFIPLLSSFACAIPGIMAARTISNWRDRLATIMIAPLMTCSARLPVYALIIGAFIPESDGGRRLQPAGTGAVRPLRGGVAERHGRRRRPQADGRPGQQHPLMLELPVVPLAACPQSAARSGRTRTDLHHARRQHHPRADGGAVVPVVVPGGAGRRQRPGDPVQLCRHAWSGARSRLCADRLQLADLDRPGARHGGARSRGRRPRHGLCAVGDRR
jgi:hypothetical protein